MISSARAALSAPSRFSRPRQLALHQLHDEEREIPVQPEVEDAHDVGVTDLRGSAGLAEEACFDALASASASGT